ncbi:MAG: shikimate dehydrogenase [Frankiaceae bacterium]|nr:shikimate dehydrogenase [Frankiaceae bacterium]MDQ1649758.1 shikimate dehydrogenase [Frankiaceae bacterium]
MLGSPIAHSLSPVLHRAAYAELGLQHWSYTAFECPSDALADRLANARIASGFGGYSLTMPLKLTALPLVDDLEPLARTVGAVNTVVPLDGRLVGCNTDVGGMVSALHAAGIADVRAPTVLGGGGSARAALAALAVLGADKVRVLMREPAKAAPLRQIADAVGVTLVVEPWGRPEDTDLIVSTVPAGAADPLAELLDHFAWPGSAALFDILYHPWPTPLAGVAQRAGVVVVGGLDLLAAQAVGQVELMTGHVVDVEVLLSAGRRALAAS